MADKATLLRLTVIAFAGIRLINYFLSVMLLDYLSALLLLLIILQALPKMDRLTAVVVSCLFFIGAGLLLACRAPFGLWVVSLLKNANLATLFVCL